MGKDKGKFAYYLFFFLFIFSCKKESITPPASNPTDLLKCPNSKIKRTHLVQLRGVFTVNAQTIVPKGDTPFPINLNVEDVKKLNLGTTEILCRVLERHGIGAGRGNLDPAPSHLPKLNITQGPGLKLKNGKTEFHIPPAEKAVELLSNFEHSLDRLLESK